MANNDPEKMKVILDDIMQGFQEKMRKAEQEGTFSNIDYLS